MSRTLLTLLLLVSLIVISCGNDMRTTKCRQIDAYQISKTDLNSEPNLSDYIVEIRDLYACNSFDSVLVVLHKAYALDKTNWLVHYYYALIALEQNRFEAANRYAESALKYVGQQNEQRALVYAVLGLTEERLNRYGEAKAHYLTSLQLDQSCEAASEGLKRLRQLTLAE